MKYQVLLSTRHVWRVTECPCVILYAQLGPRPHTRSLFSGLAHAVRVLRRFGRDLATECLLRSKAKSEHPPSSISILQPGNPGEDSDDDDEIPSYK